jgi:predicted transcriptional regulator of viral defense system
MASRAVRVFHELAETHGGHFTVDQATQAGLTHRVLSYHASTGELERVAQGVYRWARFPPHPFADVITAVLWAGDNTAASHETALAVYGLADAMPPVIHLTTPRRFRGRRREVTVHHAPLAAAEIRVFNAVPVTTPARTLVDVARSSDPSLAQEAATEAIDQGLLTHRRLWAALDSAPDAERLHAVLGLGPLPTDAS